MSQMNSNEQSKILALKQLNTINNVEGFDPEVFAVEFTDLATNETRKRLPVVIQMAWFRLVYPQGKIAVQVSSGKDCFIASARVYANYQDPVECYLAEATASRGASTTKPSVSPREWAQTAAIGIALRNAGFGLQFAIAGEEAENMPSEIPEELQPAPITTPANAAEAASEPAPETSPEEEYETVPAELSYDDKLKLAMQTPCPIKKYSGKTLGDLITIDPKALNWVATKFTGAPEITEAAKLICEDAVQKTSA